MPLSAFRATVLGESTLTVVTGGNRQRKSPSGGDGDFKRVKGVEPDQNHTNPGETSAVSASDAAKASVAGSLPMPADVNLRVVVEAWPALPNAIKAGVLAIVMGLSRLRCPPHSGSRRHSTNFGPAGWPGRRYDFSVRGDDRSRPARHDHSGSRTIGAFLAGQCV